MGIFVKTAHYLLLRHKDICGVLQSHVVKDKVCAPPVS